MYGWTWIYSKRDSDLKLIITKTGKHILLLYSAIRKHLNVDLNEGQTKVCIGYGACKGHGYINVFGDTTAIDLDTQKKSTLNQTYVAIT